MTSGLRSDTSRHYYAWDVLKALIRAHLGPLEASRGQTKQTLVGRKVVYGKLEQVGSIQQAQNWYNDNITLESIQKILIWAHLGLLEASRGQTKQTLLGIKVMYGILEQVGNVQQAQK